MRRLVRKTGQVGTLDVACASAVADGGNDLVTEYAYNAGGELITQKNKLPIGWQATSFTYTATGQQATVTDPSFQVTTYSYDTLSRRTGLDRPSALDTTYTYEADNDLDVMTHTGIVSFDHGYNAVHQLTSKTVSDPDTYMWAAATSESLTYSPNNLNQYASVSGYSGMFGSGGRTFTYDSENCLTEAREQGTLIATYTYDPLGRRRSKDVDGEGVTSIFDCPSIAGRSPPLAWLTRKRARRAVALASAFGLGGDGAALSPLHGLALPNRKLWKIREIAEYLGGALNVRYVYGPAIDDRVAMFTYNLSTGAQIGGYYYHADRLGSVIALSTIGGTVAESHAYSPYGEEVNAPPPQPGGNPYRFTGRRLDSETGLYYYRARYYSPALGRFLQTDPIGYGDNLNLYAYVGNDGVNLVDPRGLYCITVGSFDVGNSCDDFAPPKSKKRKKKGKKGQNDESKDDKATAVAAASTAVAATDEIMEALAAVGKQTVAGLMRGVSVLSMALLLSGDTPNIDYYYHYTDRVGYLGIHAEGRIGRIGGKVYLTKDLSIAQAQWHRACSL